MKRYVQSYALEIPVLKVGTVRRSSTLVLMLSAFVYLSVIRSVAVARTIRTAVFLETNVFKSQVEVFVVAIVPLISAVQKGSSVMKSQIYQEIRGRSVFLNLESAHVDLKMMVKIAPVSVQANGGFVRGLRFVTETQDGVFVVLLHQLKKFAMESIMTVTTLSMKI